MKKRVFFKINQEEELRKNLLDLAKTYPYLIDDDSEYKKAKGTKKCVIKRELMFKNYTYCLLNNKPII